VVKKRDAPANPQTQPRRDPAHRSGILCEVILPKYDICHYGAVSELRLLRTIDVTFDARPIKTKIWSGVVEGCASICVCVGGGLKDCRLSGVGGSVCVCVYVCWSLHLCSSPRG